MAERNSVNTSPSIRHLARYDVFRSVLGRLLRRHTKQRFGEIRKIDTHGACASDDVMERGMNFCYEIADRGKTEKG